MSTHLSDELPRLLTGEASREEVLRAAEHLRACVDCQQELVSAVVAHASLTSAQRFAPEIVAGQARDLLDEPDAEPPEVGPLPDLSPVFAQVRDEASSRLRRPRTHRARLALGAAAAAVVIGAGVGTAVVVTGDNGHHTSATHTVQLAAFQHGTSSGTAIVDESGRVVIDAASLPRLDRPGGYEVWLTDSDRNVLRSVGWLRPDRSATLTVRRGLLDHFKDIEISVQPTGASEYSGVSVLRGSYT